MNREKVMSALDCRANDTDIDCRKCDYYIREDKPEYCDFRGMLRDALALLKEQEAVKPILVREGWNKHHNNYVCPRCDNDVFYEQNYCTECGVRFLWEGR